MLLIEKWGKARGNPTLLLAQAYSYNVACQLAMWLIVGVGWDMGDWEAEGTADGMGRMGAADGLVW